MNRSGFYAIITSLLFLCFGCSTISVQTDYNPAFDFSGLKSYAWLESGQSPSEDTRINNDLVIDRVRAAVEQSLENKGFVKAEGERADFMVNWHGAIDKKIQVKTIDHFYSPYGYGPLSRDPFWGSSVRSSTAYEYEVGTLIIDILDPVAHKLLWRGSGQDRIREKKKPEEIGAGIREAVTAIMKDFPPSP